MAKQRESVYFVKNLSGIEKIADKQEAKQECSNLPLSVLVDEEETEGPYGRIPPPYCSDMV